MKHTATPVSSSNLNSVFNQNDYDTYNGYILEGLNSGSVELDNQKRYNLILIANNPVGTTYQGSNPSQTVDAVKIVLYNDPQKIHAFPTSSLNLKNEKCSKCGNSIKIWS